MSATTSKAVLPGAKNPLLAAYLRSLATRPLYTKAVTAGVLSFLQEILANHLAGVTIGVTSKSSPLETLRARLKIDSRAFKLAAYGFFVSAPMGHYLVGALQAAFAGKEGVAAKLGMLLANNAFVAPIQTFVYLACMAIIGGAKSRPAIMSVVKAGYVKLLSITWVVSPLAVLTAQAFVPQELWVVYFNLVSFSLGTASNVALKKAKARALKEEKAKKEREQEKAKEQANQEKREGSE